MSIQNTHTRWLWSILCAVISAHTVTPALAQGAPPAVVMTDAAKIQPLQRQRSATGDVRAIRRARLAAQVEGFVVSFDAFEGQVVKAGELIAQLDDERARFDLDRAVAEHEAAKALVLEQEAEVERAENDLDRLRQLDRDGISSPQELDDAIAADRSARAMLASAEAQVTAAAANESLAKRHLKDTKIVAPFDGVVVERLSEVGQWVGAGGEIVTVVATGQVDVWIDVPERYVRFLNTNGSPAKVEIDIPSADLHEQVTVTRVVPVADERSRLFPVVIRMDDHEGMLRPGMSVTAMVPTGETAPVMTVHKDAVLRDDAGLFVYWAPPHTDESNPGVSGIAAVARIERLFGAGDRIAVGADIPPEGRVIVEGNERLFPGQPLMITERGGKPTGKPNGEPSGEQGNKPDSTVAEGGGA